MPCNSDYMEANESEKFKQRTAQLLRFVLRTLGRKVPENVTTTATDSYAHIDFTPDLCEIMTSLSSKKRKALMSLGSRRSLELGIWWLDHVQADKLRIKAARDTRKAREAEKQRITLRSAARRKIASILSKKEMRALGYK